MKRKERTAHLYLNGNLAGTVHVHGSEDAWYHGHFEPADGFSAFATVFGRWSLLLHAEDGQDRQSREALDELRKLEYEMDAIEVRLFFPDKQEWHKAIQLNIDGPLVEWKEY
jgi:hypothetical protein